MGDAVTHKAKSSPRDETPDKPKSWTRRVMSRDEITVRTGMQAYEAGRFESVIELKADVWSGAYDPDIDEVAEAMLSEREAECTLTRSEEMSDLQDQTGANG